MKAFHIPRPSLGLWTQRPYQIFDILRWTRTICPRLCRSISYSSAAQPQQCQSRLSSCGCREAGLSSSSQSCWGPRATAGSMAARPRHEYGSMASYAFQASRPPVWNALQAIGRGLAGAAGWVVGASGSRSLGTSALRSHAFEIFESAGVTKFLARPFIRGLRTVPKGTPAPLYLVRPPWVLLSSPGDLHQELDSFHSQFSLMRRPSL